MDPPFSITPGEASSHDNNEIFSFEDLLSNEGFNNWVDLNCWPDFDPAEVEASSPSWMGNYSSPNTSSLGSLPSTSSFDSANLNTTNTIMPQPGPAYSFPQPVPAQTEEQLSPASKTSYQMTPHSVRADNSNKASWQSYTSPSASSSTSAPALHLPISTNIPNQPLSSITPLINPTPFSANLTTSLHTFHTHPYIYKSGATPHELRMHLAAGPCAITVHSTVSTSNNNNHPTNTLSGMILSHETPLNPKLYLPTQRQTITSGMKHAVFSLHSRNIIHGDITLSNFLFCASDSSIRLTDFHAAHYEREDEGEEEEWDLVMSGKIVSPKRAREWMKGVDMRGGREEDLFALGICVWEVWTGRRYLGEGGEFEKKGGWEALRMGKCVNVGLVPNKGVRALVRGWLRGAGGVV